MMIEVIYLLAEVPAEKCFYKQLCCLLVIARPNADVIFAFLFNQHVKGHSVHGWPSKNSLVSVYPQRFVGSKHITVFFCILLSAVNTC